VRGRCAGRIGTSPDYDVVALISAAREDVGGRPPEPSDARVRTRPADS
jgi:hypothetical protein